ncbi:MAG: hypothetical protein OCD76_07345 [Reichenbachiella sp.]
MGFFSNIGNVVSGFGDLSSFSTFSGDSKSGRDIFSALFDPGDITGTQASKAKKKRRKELRIIEEKRARLQSSKQVAEQIRKSIIARAQIIQAGENQNVGGSSAISGGAGSVLSQAGGNISFINQLQGSNETAGKRLAEIADINTQQAETQGFVNLATTFAGGV